MRKLPSWRSKLPFGAELFEEIYEAVGGAQYRLVPRHSDFGWLILSQSRMGKSSGGTRIWMLLATPVTPNEAISFEHHDHLVDRGRADLKVALHIGFGGRAPEHVRIGVDEGQVLALLFGEALSAASGA